MMRKLNMLEKEHFVNVDNPNPDECHIVIDNPVEEELHRQARAIIERYESDIADYKKGVISQVPQLTPSEWVLLDQSHKLLMARCLDLFDKSVAVSVHFNNPIAKLIFYTRLNWLIHELTIACGQQIQQDAIYQTTGFFDLCHGEQDRLLKPVEDKWRSDLFTEDSFNQFLAKQYNIKSKEQIIADLAKRTPEQVMQDELDDQADEELERKGEEQDKKFLVEKCPSCNDKCDWYKKETFRKNK